MGRRSRAGLCAVLALVTPVLVACPVVAEEAVVDPYRPAYHFTTADNWINDPNGPVWYDGEYHLFFQHNPEGTLWGNMSWGHAVSQDLVHWQERPLALRFSPDEHIFSGSVVVDERNTTGFGTPGTPALVAIYTSWNPSSGIQAQSLAYSTDGGETWNKYAGNPVLDLRSTEFRDPRVFWYEEGGYWVMAVALAVDRKIQLYRSADLKSWTHLSDFGPANAVGGVWEMPDLFELPVEGRPGESRWVLVVNLNPGSVAGGSGAQYFVGDFDGTTFTAHDVVTDNDPPAGTVLADFEGDAYAPGWTTTGTAFGARPATGTLPGQQPVRGQRGQGLVNTFLDVDRSQGTLTSPPFVVTEDYLNLLVGGGNHPRRAGTGDGAPPPGEVFAGFDGPDFEGWAVAGNAFGARPREGNAPCQEGVTGYRGSGLANSFHNGDADVCDLPPDGGTGSLTSPEFTITERHINFLVGGGAHADTAVRLLVDGQPVRTTSGAESGVLNWASWDVENLAGRRARIQILDDNPGGWGHIMADAFTFSTTAAVPRSTETTVNLVVDGTTVRTATGQDSELLDWVAWDVRDLAGRTARLQVVDHNSTSWGHILLDHVMASSRPAASSLERFGWLDYGKDFYAALTFENAPGDKRIAISWMNNWQYAHATPTGGWRGAMSLPRELTLRSVDGEPRLIQRPVDPAPTSRVAYELRNRTIRTGVTTLPSRARGTVVAVEAEFELRDARRFGLHVRAGSGQRTVVGYDARSGKVYVDRTSSGDVGFHPDFAGVHAGPLTVRNGRVKLTVYVDRSSVEVVGNQGETLLTDLVYPALRSDGVALFAEGGDVLVRRLTVRPLE